MFSYFRTLSILTPATANQTAMETTTDYDTRANNDSDLINREAVIACTIILFVFGLTGNGLIVYGYARFRRLRTRTNYFVVNLATADLLLTAVLGAWIIEEIRGIPFDRSAKMFINNIDVLCFSASMFSMTAVSLDRYFAITNPLRYENTVTRLRALIATVIIWSSALVMFSIGVSRYFVKEMDTPVANKVFMTTLTVINFGIPALIMVFAHVSIFRIALKSKSDKPDAIEMQNARVKDMSKTFKLSFNTLAILVPMAIAWGIFFGVTVLEAHCPTMHIAAHFSVVVGLLPYIAAAIDPIVYILLTRDLRLKLCRCL